MHIFNSTAARSVGAGDVRLREYGREADEREARRQAGHRVEARACAGLVEGRAARPHSCPVPRRLRARRLRTRDLPLRPAARRRVAHQLIRSH